MSIYITFLGPSGAGKTTIAENLAKTMAENGYNILTRKDFLEISRLKRHLYPAVYALKKRKALKTVFLYIIFLFKNINKFNKQDIKSFYYSFKHFLIINFLINQKKTDMVIYDESLIRHLYYINRFKDKNRHLYEFLEKIVESLPARKKVYVEIKVPTEVSLNRVISDRNPENREARKHLVQMKRKKLSKLYKKNIAKRRKVLQHLKNKKNIEIFTIDGKKPFRENIKFLKNEILKKLFI